MLLRSVQSIETLHRMDHPLSSGYHVTVDVLVLTTQHVQTLAFNSYQVCFIVVVHFSYTNIKAEREDVSVMVDSL